MKPDLENALGLLNVGTRSATMGRHVLHFESSLTPSEGSRRIDSWEPPAFSWLPSPEPDPEPFALSRSFSAEPLGEELHGSFSLGPAGGYLSARGAARRTWFGGVPARLHFAGNLAAEASLTFHQDCYQSGGVVVTQYPLQLTAFLYIIPDGPIRPYLLGVQAGTTRRSGTKDFSRSSMTGRSTSSANALARGAN